jgi:hypothetical protein
LPFAMWARDACPVDVEFGGISGGDALFGSAAARDRASTGTLSSATLATSRVLRSSASEKCCLTAPSLLSMVDRRG